MRKLFFPILLIFFAANLSASETFGSQQLKKAPQTYWLSPESPTQPVKIGTPLKATQTGIILRDPILSRKGALPRPKEEPQALKPKTQRSRNKTMKIGKVRISGELTIPTVSFTPERPECTFVRDQPAFQSNSPLPLNKP